MSLSPRQIGGRSTALTDVTYLARVHFLYSPPFRRSFPNIRTVLLDTRLLKNKSVKPLSVPAEALLT